MRTAGKYTVFMILALWFAGASAQFKPGEVSRVEDGRVFLQLDLRWSDAQKKEAEKLFSLDSTVWVQLGEKGDAVVSGGETWSVKRSSAFLVELSKALANQPVFNINDIFLDDEDWQVAPGYVDQDKVVFGANNFRNNRSFSYRGGTAVFFLPGYAKASEVYIAGSFNDWKPWQVHMQKSDSGWTVSLPLATGKYLYKYIVDGKWMRDPGNSQSENDGTGNVNSVAYCTNHVFNLKGYTRSRRVVVSGTFNNWRPSGIRMQPVPGGWSLPVYLKDGTWSYKFIVDGQWMPDPANPVLRTDADGNQNSVVSFGEKHLFVLNGYTDAVKVRLAGNFNNWNTAELVMEKTPGGWQLPLSLAAGNYEYKFIVDGKWITDPANPFKTGKGDHVNSLLAFKANHVFSLDKFPGAGEVRISGSFNGWNPDGYKMEKKDGKWTFPLYLAPGKYLYKIIVDGTWMLDPGNKLWEENEYGTGNSILWIPGGI